MSHFKSFGKINSINTSIASHEWIIEKFNTIDLATGLFITSPMFPTDNPDIEWRLALFPNGRNKKSDDYLDVCLQLFSNKEEEEEEEEADIDVLVKILNGDNRNVEAEKYRQQLFKLMPLKEYYNNLLPGAYSCVVNKETLVENRLEIRCDVILTDPVFVSSSQFNPSRNNSRLSEFDGFKKLLTDDKFSDFTIVAGGQSIPVHKAILANRSPVFEAMFSNEMQEKNQNTAEIIDIRYPVLKQFFQYIYTGTVDDIENMAHDLLIAADKYCVTSLKVLCEKTLSKNLNADNVLKNLVLADTYNSASLKTQAIRFIANNPSEVVEKEEFTKLRSVLMCEITRCIVRRLDSQ